MSEPRFTLQPDGSLALTGPEGLPLNRARYLAASAWSEGFAVVVRADSGPGLVAVDGQELRLEGRRFAWILPMHQGRAPAGTREGEVGFIDPTGAFHVQPSDPEWRARVELTRVAHGMYGRGYNVSIDGNLSWRLDDGNILLSPTCVHLGFIRPEDFVVVDPDGALLRGERGPSSEIRLHLALHRSRPDCRAVVHAHAPNAVAASLAGVDLSQTYISVAPIPTTVYARISSAESAASIGPVARDYNWAILPRHGVVAWAPTPWEAFLRIEGLEHCARIVMTARACGPVEPLSAPHRDELLLLWGVAQPV